MNVNDQQPKVVAVHADSPVACPDCASTTVQLDYGEGVQAVVVLHSDACPAWAGDGRDELIAVLTPPTKEETA